MIAEWLKTLGSTSDEVAESLKAQGIRGKRRSACNCPIANALTRAFPSGAQAKVCSSVFGEGGYIVEYHGEHQLPPAVLEFVGRFDRGEYQELIGK